MRKILADELPIGKILDQDLYDDQKLLLCKAGEVLEEQHVNLALKMGPGYFYLMQSDIPQETIRSLKRKVKELGLGQMSIEELPKGEALPFNVYDGKGNVLLSKGQMLTDQHMSTLYRRGSNRVWIVQKKTFVDEENPEESFKRVADRMEERLKTLGGVSLARSSDPVLDRISRSITRTEEVKAKSMSLLNSLGNDAESILQDLQKGRGFDGRSVMALASKTMTSVYGDINLFASLIASMPIGDSLVEWRSHHLVNTLITTLAMGTYAGYDEEQLAQLGACAFLHDVGMVYVRPAILEKPGKLTLDETIELQSHPIHGVNILERVEGISQHTLFGIYQSHERVGGQGYPKGRKGTHIHSFAKLLAVADTYCALRSNRPHRTALSPYEATKSVIYMASHKMLAPEAVRSLLKTVGLFPVGSFVKLSDGRIARVIGMPHNADRFDRPIVSIIVNEQGRVDNEHVQVNLLEEEGLQITDTIESDVVQNDPLVGF